MTTGIKVIIYIGRNDGRHGFMLEGIVHNYAQGFFDEEAFACDE